MTGNFVDPCKIDFNAQMLILLKLFSLMSLPVWAFRFNCDLIGHFK